MPKTPEVFTFEKFTEKLKAGMYADSTAARRGVGKTLWTTAKKDEARALIEKHFSGKSAGKPAAKPVTKGKPGPKPKAKSEAPAPKAKPGPKPKAKLDGTPKAKPGPKPKAKTAAPAAKSPGRPKGSAKLKPVQQAAGEVLKLAQGVLKEDQTTDLVKILELAIAEQNALSNIIAAAAAAKEVCALRTEEVQGHLDLFTKLTGRIDAILDGLLERVDMPVGIQAKAPASPEPVQVASEEGNDEEEEEEGPTPAELTNSHPPVEVAPANGAEEEARRSKLWAGALPLAPSLRLNGARCPEQSERLHVPGDHGRTEVPVVSSVKGLHAPGHGPVMGLEMD